MTRDEARRIAANNGKLPVLLKIFQLNNSDSFKFAGILRMIVASFKPITEYAKFFGDYFSDSEEASIMAVYRPCSARICLTAVLLLGGVTFAIAQNGPATGGYPPGAKNPNSYGYYGYSGYYARPRYAPDYSYYCRTPYYVLGYPVPHYGYMGWCGRRY